MLIQYCISYLIVGVILLGISITVFLKNKTVVLNRVFAVYSFSIAWWTIFSIPAILSIDNRSGANWCRIFIVGPIFMPTLFLHFVITFLRLDKKYNWLVKLCYLVSTFFLLSNTTKFFIKAAEVKFSLRSYTVPGIFFHFHVLYFVVATSIGILLLYKGFQDKTFREPGASPYRRVQISYLLWSSLIGYIGGIPNYLLVYRIEIPFLNPFGTYTVALYGITVAYIIIKYRLLDITLTLTRTSIFIAVYTIVLGLPFAVSIWFKAWFMKIFGANWYFVSMGLMAVLATLGPFLYIFLERRAEERLLKEQKSYQRTLRQASMGMTRIRDLRRLLELIAHIVTKSVGISYVGIYLHNKESGEYVLQVSRDKGRESILKLGCDNSLIAWIMLKRQPLIYEEVKRLSEEIDNDGYKSLEENMRLLTAAVVIPSFLEDKFMGFIVLGDKFSGQIYTADDLNVFQVLANQAGLAIENAQFYDETKQMHEQIAHAEKMATIGTMADGLSHQINNRFYALSLIAEDTIDNIKCTDTSQCSPEIKEMIGQINYALGRIKQNVIQGGQVVKGILKYTRKSEEGFEPVTLDQIIKETLEMVQYKIKLSEIDIIRNYGQDLPKIMGNPIQLQECWFNFIDNGYDTIVERRTKLEEQGYRGRIEFSALVKLEQGVIEIRISDNGMGIKPENMKKLFTPFFTTKVSSRQGTGLGLYVIKRIVEEMHQGRIRIESEYGKGTTFFIELPIAKE